MCLRLMIYSYFNFCRFTALAFATLGRLGLLAVFFMAALCIRAGHYIFALWFLSSIFYISVFPRLISAAAGWICLPYFDTWCGPSANLECRSERCCTRLAANAGPKKVPKNRYLGTIAQLCRAMSSQLKHVSTIGKKLVKEQYLLYMFPQYGELRPTSG